jgi:hypothetical protein
MASAAAPNSGQGRKLEGTVEENPCKKAVLGVLPAPATTQAMCAQTLEKGLTEAEQTPYAAKAVPSPLPEDGSKVPLPNEEDGDEDKPMAEADGKEAPFFTEPIMKNYMDKYFNTTVFAEFKKDTAEVTQAIANHMKVDLSTKEKLDAFMDHKPTNAEVIALIHAHFDTITVPMVKIITKNIDDLFHSLSARTTALHHSLNWPAAEQRLLQKEVSRCQIVLMGFPKSMPPEARHRFVSNLIINVRELAQHMLEVRIASSDAEIQCEPERGLQLLACLPTTVTTGANTYSHITVLTSKAHYLRDYCFKHYTGNTSVPLRDDKDQAVANTHIKIQLGAQAYQRKLESILRVALRAHADYHEGSDKDHSKLTILWKTLTVLKSKKDGSEQEAIFTAAYNPTEDGYVTCDITVSQAFNSLLNDTNEEGRRYWDAAWDSVIRVHHHQLDQAEDFAARDSAEKDETQSKKPKRHYADAFAKDNSAFPLFIVWNVVESIEFDQEEAKKKSAGNKSSYPQSASSAASSRQTPTNFRAQQQYGGDRGDDAWSTYKKTSAAPPSTCTTLPCRPANTMHWKIPFNWMDNGGLPTQVGNATTKQVASALGLHPSQFSSIESLEQADWVKIIEKVFTDTQKLATKTNVLLDNQTIIKRCKKSCYTPKSIKEGRHQTMGAWLMDFLWTETLVRAHRNDPSVAFVAVPNTVYKLLWDQTTTATDDPEWDTKQSGSNSEQVSNIIETWATFLLLEKDTNSIRLLLNSLIHIDGNIDRELLHKSRPADGQYPAYMIWNKKNARDPPTA